LVWAYAFVLNRRKEFRSFHRLRADGARGSNKGPIQDFSKIQGSLDIGPLLLPVLAAKAANEVDGVLKTS
jgi:hypothetical protein